MSSDNSLLYLLGFVLGGLALKEAIEALNSVEITLLLLTLFTVLVIALGLYVRFFSSEARDRRKSADIVNELPECLKTNAPGSIVMGFEDELKIPIYLPDNVRSRHIHILGATGSGKTESVILNFLRQDTARGLGSIILDAKGDSTFLEALDKWTPKGKLQVFDLGSAESLPYDPLGLGSPIEASQRLFASLTWSEPYYASKARSALLKIFDFHFGKTGRNPSLREINDYLESAGTFAVAIDKEGMSPKETEREFSDLSGLRDQISSLCTGYLSKTLSPESELQVNLAKVAEGHVVYFRLQSLLSPQLVATLGRLIINHLNYLAGMSHRASVKVAERKITPIYLDEFASFACLEFADLISKARSAGFALHFSHQSIGDLEGVAQGFLNRITDNSATKIIMRINDPDSAEYFARSFGTREFQKVTQRITNAKDLDSAEIVGEGTQRDAHQFRASPDLLKTLPTGMGAVMIAHGQRTAQGASTVFKVRFPSLDPIG